MNNKKHPYSIEYTHRFTCSGLTSMLAKVLNFDYYNSSSVVLLLNLEFTIIQQWLWFSTSRNFPQFFTLFGFSTRCLYESTLTAKTGLGHFSATLK